MCAEACRLWHGETDRAAREGMKQPDTSCSSFSYCSGLVISVLLVSGYSVLKTDPLCHVASVWEIGSSEDGEKD